MPMPPSPPNTPGNISATAAASSPMPSVIIAKVVPALRVQMKPSTAAAAPPASPPNSGMNGRGMAGAPCEASRIACTAANAPSPV